MSEFLAEASILIQANTVAFRRELAAALATVPKAIEVPIVATGGGSAAALRKKVATSTTEMKVATDAATVSLNREAVASARAGAALQRQASSTATTAAAERHAAARRNEITKGLQAQALSAVGLRGAIIGANSAFLAATAGAILFGKSIQSAAQFQTELATFAATTGASAEQIQSVSAAAKQLGADLTLPGVNAQDAAVAMTELAKAGLSVQESISGARGVLQLATAAGIDNAAATELAASALNAFGLAGTDAVHVADVLANSSNDAQGSIVDIGIALQQASAAGRQAGLSLEQTVGILTEFARAGIKGSDAGTLLRTLLIRLINPTDKAAEVIQRLGLHIRDATGNVNLAFFDEFARKTKNLTAAERDRDAAIIAGQDAFRGLTILARTGGVALDAQVAALNKQGTAADLAAARTSGLAGAAENLKNQLATAGLAFGQSLAPGLTDLANLTAEAIGTVHNLVTEVGDLADAASKPIDIVVNVIRNVLPGGGGGGEKDTTEQTRKDVQGRLKSIFSLGETAPALLGDVNALANEFNAVIEDKFGQGIGGIDFPTLKEARKQIHDLITEINQNPGSSTTLNQAVTNLIKIRDEMAKGTFGTKEFSKSLTPFIARLQQLSGTRVVLPPIEFPKTLEAGAEAAVAQGSKQAANTGSHAFAAEFIPSMGNAFKSAATAGWQAFQDAGARNAAEAARAVAAQVAAAVAGAKQGANQQSGLDDLFNQLLLSGASPQQQVASLQKQFAVQQGIIDKASKGLDGLTSRDKGFGTLTQKLRAARTKQVSIQNQIRQINETAASNAKQQASESAAAATKADQAVLDSFSQGQHRVNLAEITANATGRVKDAIAVQNLIISTAQREEKAIEDGVKNVKTKNAELAKRVETIKAATAERDRLIEQAAKDATEKRQAAANALTESLGKRITLAGLRENDKAEIAAINKAITNARFRIRNYKKLGLNLLDEKIALEELINQRAEVNKTKDEANKGQGTTAFDLLKEAADTFNKSAGNLIGGNQPFAGPTGFTADIAQFLIRRQQPAGPTSTASKTPVPPVALQDQPLIQAIEKLTDAIIGTSGNASTAGGTPSARQSRVWHSENLIARRFQEA